MKIWTLTVDDDHGVETHVFRTLAAASEKAREIVAQWWEMADNGRLMPESWEDAQDILQDIPGFFDSVRVAEHALTDGPANKDRANAYRAAAMAKAREGELEVDDGAPVSEGDDPGAYVQAWIWISAAEAGVGHGE